MTEILCSNIFMFLYCQITDRSPLRSIVKDLSIYACYPGYNVLYNKDIQKNTY